MVQKVCVCNLGGSRCTEPAAPDSIFCVYCEDHGFHHHCTGCSARYIPHNDSDRLCPQCRGRMHT